MKVAKLFLGVHILFLGFYSVYSMEVNRPNPQEREKLAFLHRSYEKITDEFGRRIQVSPELRKKLAKEEINDEKRCSINREIKKEDDEDNEEYVESSHALFDTAEFEGL